MRKKLNQPTFDREGPGPPDHGMLVNKIGARQSITPEGFLLCEDVPIARTGWMIYGPGETPIEIDPHKGYARVYRDEEDLFADDTLRSMEGKAIVDEHPSEDVAPKNWKQYARGHVFNVRQGEGEERDDCIVLSLLVTDEDTIKAVQSGKREVSAGYTADYQQTGVGEGLQTNIIFNHLALVEKGRCGPRCAIGDHHPQLTEEGNHDMGTKTQGGLAPKRRQLSQATLDAIAAQLTSEQEDEVDASADNHTHIHIHTAATKDGLPNDDEDEGDDKKKDKAKTDDCDRMDKLEKSVSDVAAQVAKVADSVAKLTKDAFPPKDDDKGDDDKEKKEKAKTDDEGDDDDTEKKDKAKTADSAALETGFKETLALAEVLVPGFRMPTFDASAKRAVTIDAMCGARRSVLATAYSTADGKELIDGLTSDNVDLAKMECPAVAALFKHAANVKKLLNNRSATSDANKLPQGQQVKSGPQTPADLNKLHRDFYGTKH